MFFDCAHVAKPLSPPLTGQEVWIPDRRQFVSVAKRHVERYEVKTPTGIYRRNRVQLNKMALRDVRSDHVSDPSTPSREHSNS